MKKTVTVLLLATALSAAAQEDPNKTQSGPFVMCNTAAYALCIKAPCEKKSPDGKEVLCECVMQSGWNMGPGSCEERAKTLTSTYSNNFNPYSATMSCPQGTKWALCYGAKCERDPKDPSKATCKCPVLEAPMTVMVSRDLCGDPSKVCSVLWSAATPEASNFANTHFYSWMTDHGMPANPPAPACPAAK
ncbi:MAG TPA: hypothetical protein VKB93_23590 [Thermoanaerobaculia bacterium]|nr:hypothetical protein [Thermoanaerobaculia bacterium]